jgi:hypothetical protein
MTSPFAIEFDRYLSQFPALQAAIERYEAVDHALLIEVKPAALGIFTDHMIALMQLCQSFSDFDTAIVEWRGTRQHFKFEDLQMLHQCLMTD